MEQIAMPWLQRITAPEARDRSLARVAMQAAPGFADAAREAIVAACRRHGSFIVDEVWAEMPRGITTGDKRAMGAAMRDAARSGLIEATDTFRPSSQVQCHANPRRVWRAR